MADDIKIVGLSSKKSGGTNWKVISAIIGIIVLSVGVIAGIMLVRQNQNIEEKALECSLGGNACPDPNNPSLLRDCSTGETFPNDSLCNSAGRVEVCGTSSSNARQYCCPSAGAAWTTNLSLCNVAPTPTATTRPTATATTTATATATTTATSAATATATSTSASKTATPTATSTTKATATATSAGKTATPTFTAKASSTATAKATSMGSATAFPVPETGAEWPTVIGAGFGIIMLLVSLALAL